MKTIPLDDAIELLDNCLAVCVDDNWLAYPATDSDSDDGIFLRLTDEHSGQELEFAANDNATPTVTVDGQLILRANHSPAHGNDYTIMPLTAKPITL